MALCRVCSGDAGYKRKICVTCSLLCPRCRSRLKNKSGYCAPCYNEHRRPKRNDTASNADPVAYAKFVAWRRVYNRYSKRIERGKLERQPCAECGVGGKTMLHLHDYPNSESIIWLCPEHHRVARPVGRPAHLPKKKQDA